MRDVHPLMTAIGLGLPITLLIDLVDPNGPRSAEVYAHEDVSLDDVANGAPPPGFLRSARTA